MTSPQPASGQTDPLAFGAHYRLTRQKHVSLPVDKFWSAFDNPHDVINMPAMPATHLVSKDDTEHVWKGHINRPTSLFSFYEATITVQAAESGANVSISIDVVFVEEDRDRRMAVANSLHPLLLVTNIVDFVLERDGKRLDFEFEVIRPIDELWGIVGNWHDISWVQGAQSVIVFPDGPPANHPARTIKFEYGDTYEFLNSIDHDAKSFTYTVERSAGMPVYAYKATLALSETPAQASTGSCTVSYSNVFLPDDSMDADAVAQSIKEALESRFAWIRSNLATVQDNNVKDI